MISFKTFSFFIFSGIGSLFHQVSTHQTNEDTEKYSGPKSKWSHGIPVSTFETADLIFRVFVCATLKCFV